jgi:uncharacterized protein YodC (DUF2158 family)
MLIDVTVMSGPPLLSFTTSPMLNDMQVLQSYEIGALVRLNSGGPDMLVIDYADPGTVVVSWLDRAGAVQEHTFPNQCVYRTTTETIQSSRPLRSSVKDATSGTREACSPRSGDLPVGRTRQRTALHPAPSAGLASSPTGCAYRSIYCDFSM